MPADPIGGGGGESAESLFNQALDHHDRGAFDDAIRCYKRAVELDPKLVIAHNNLGMVYIDKEMFDEAIQELVKTIELDAEYAEAYNNLGFAYRRTQNDGKAAACYEKFLGMEPDVEDAPKIRGWLEAVKASLGGTLPPIIDRPVPAPAKVAARPQPTQPAASPGLPASAVQTVKMRHVVSPASAAAPAGPTVPAVPAAPSAEALCEQGIAEFERDNLDGAEQILRQAVEANPSVAVAHSALGRVLAKMGRFTEAVAELSQAVSLDPADAAAYYVLGFTYRSLQRDSDAADAYDRYLELTPDAAEGLQIREWIGEVRSAKPRTPQAHFERASAFYQQGKLDEALEICEELAIVDESFSAASLLLGQILIQKGDYIRAVPSLKRAERGKEVSPEVEFYLGQAYEKRGMPDDARAAYLKYLELAPDGPNAATARSVAEKVSTRSPQAAGPRCQYCFRGFAAEQLQVHEGKKICPDCLANLDASTEPDSVAPSLQPSVVERATAEATASRERKVAAAKVVKTVVTGAVVFVGALVLLVVALRAGLLAKTGAHAALRNMGLSGVLSTFGVDLSDPAPDVPDVDGPNGPGKLPVGPVEPVAPVKAVAIVLPSARVVTAPSAPFTMQVGIDQSDLQPEYKLVSPPEGMAIDAASGVISWDPRRVKDLKRRYAVTVAAVLPDKRELTAKFDLHLHFGFSLGQAVNLGVARGDDVRFATVRSGDRHVDDLVIAWGKYRRGALCTLRSSANGELAAGGPVDLGGVAAALAVADVTGDGRSDIVVANWFTRLIVVYGLDRDGVIKMTSSLAAPRGVDSICPGDIDLDGKTDLVVTSSTVPALNVYLQRNAQDGTSALTEAAEYSTNKVSGWNAAYIGPIRDGVRAVYMVCGSGEGPMFRLFKLMAGGRLDFYTAPELDGVTMLRPLATALVRGADGGPMLAALEGGADPHVYVLMGKGENLAPAAKPEMELAPFPLGMLAADMNGDRLDDLVVLYPEELRVFLSSGKTDYGYGSAVVVKVPGAVGPAVVGEFTSDGRTDLAIALDDGTIQIVKSSEPEEDRKP